MKKLILFLVLLLVFNPVAWAGFTNEFDVGLGDYTHDSLYTSASDAVVSGGKCAISVTGNVPGPPGLSWIEIDDVTLPFSAFIKYGQANIPLSGGRGTLIGVGEADKVMDASRAAFFEHTQGGTKRRNDNMNGSGTFYTTAAFNPLYVWIAVDSGGTITVKYKESLTTDWVLLPQTGAEFDLSGDSKCKFALFAVASNTYTWEIDIDYIRDVDPTPSTDVRNPWKGFVSWKGNGFNTW